MQAEDTTSVNRTAGITATLQGVDPGVNIPFWVSSNLTIGPAFSVVSVKDAGTDYMLMLGAKYYIYNNRLSPYADARAGIMRMVPTESGNSATDLIGGLAFGGEYFFDPLFSVSVELQANLTRSDELSMRFGRPDGTVFNTASMVAASVYF